jgi:phosphatidate phosphatase APP1
VCVGDSTQSDPEAYAEFYHHLVRLNKGGRVARIFIRKVSGVNKELEVKLNAPERFEKAFEGIPNTLWKVFEDGREMLSEIEKLKAERAGGPAAAPQASA